MFADLFDIFFPFGFIVVILVVVGLVMGLSIYFDRKRTEAMQAAADELGLPFFPQGDQSLIDELGYFDLFSQGRSRKIKNMIHGETDAVDIGIFDYQYTTGSGKNSHTYKQSVICFNSSDLNLPKFSMRQEGFFDKIGGMLGFQDIDFDTHPTFSAAYVLKGENEELVRQTFRAEILEYLESINGVNVEGGATRLIYFRAGRTIRPEDVRSFMSEGFAVYSLFSAL